MYGALTGLSKKKTRTVYGEKQFKKWRRSYNTRPPPVSSFSQHYPGNDQRYVENVIDIRWSCKETLIRSLEAGKVRPHRKLPRSESLKNCMDRTIPYWVRRHVAHTRTIVATDWLASCWCRVCRIPLDGHAPHTVRSESLRMPFSVWMLWLRFVGLRPLGRSRRSRAMRSRVANPC